MKLKDGYLYLDAVGWLFKCEGQWRNDAAYKNLVALSYHGNGMGAGSANAGESIPYNEAGFMKDSEYSTSEYRIVKEIRP